jgi:hypothetical protein
MSWNKATVRLAVKGISATQQMDVPRIYCVRIVSASRTTRDSRDRWELDVTAKQYASHTSAAKRENASPVLYDKQSSLRRRGNARFPAIYRRPGSSDEVSNLTTQTDLATPTPYLPSSPSETPRSPAPAPPKICQSVSPFPTTPLLVHPPNTVPQTNTVPGAPACPAYQQTPVSAPPAAVTTSAKQGIVMITGGAIMRGRRRGALDREARGRVGVGRRDMNAGLQR